MAIWLGNIICRIAYKTEGIMNKREEKEQITKKENKNIKIMNKEV